jgi:erythromycin esterase
MKMKQKLIARKCLLLLGVVFFLEKKTNAQDTTKYIELSSVEVTGYDDDLQQLSTYFNDVTLVGMGESTHGTHEFFTMRYRMFKYLVEHHQFTTFFLEADYANCLRANAYIHGKDDDAIDVIKEIDMWPWKTHEMVDLINWMRTHNLENPEMQLNFIGVDMQRYVENIKKMDDILTRYKLPTIDSAIYQKILKTNFFSVTETEDLKIYKSAWQEKKAIDISSLNEEDKRVYNILLRHLTQTISEKYKWEKQYDYRDRRMAENILSHLKGVTLIKGFFWAHNGHINDCIRKKRKKEDSWKFVGGHLKYAIGKKYFIIGQEFDEGAFNAYYPDSNSTKIINGKGYTLGPQIVKPSIEGSFATKYRHLKSPVFIDCSKFSKKEPVSMSFIGALYLPERDGKPKSRARNEHFGNLAFDAIILVKKSTPTHLLEKIENINR